MDKIIAFFMSIWLFFLSLFGINPNQSNVETVKDIAYDTQHKLQTVDIYIPEDVSETASLILFIHGGAWVGGSKDVNAASVRNIAGKYGYVAASMNYRLFGNGAQSFDDMLYDVGKCLEKIKSVCAEKGINITGCALHGQSAGSHLSMLYAYTKNSQSAVPVKFVVNQCGPTDLTNEAYLNDNVNAIAATILGINRPITKEDLEVARPFLEKVSPITYVSTAVPTLIGHGTKDSIVPYENAVDLADALKNANVRYDFITYNGSDHDLSGDKDADNKFFSLYESYAKEYFGY